MARKRKVTIWFGADITEIEKKWKHIDSGMKSWSRKMERFGSQMSRTVTAPLVGLGAYAARETISFETAFARVRKTVNATEEEFKALERGIRGMSLSKDMSSSAEGIAEVAAAAGQLGIAKENILSFSKVMIQLGETSNLSAQDGATSLAKFANVTRMSHKHFDRLGSTVVAVGNSLATTERDVVEMAQHMAGAGRVVGLTEAQTIAFAGALASVGVEAQMGGSAFSKLIVRLQTAVVTGNKELKGFAAVARMSASEFQAAFATNPAEAIRAFVEGLGALEGSGVTAIEVLEQMGLTEIRLRDALLRLAGASDIVNQSLALGTKAWEENRALAEKSAVWNRTTGAEMKRLGNRMQETARGIGTILLPELKRGAAMLEEWVKRFGELDPEVRRNAVTWAAYAAAIGPVSLVMSALIKQARNLGNLFLWLGQGSGAPVVALTLAVLGLAAAWNDAMNAQEKYYKRSSRQTVDRAQQLTKAGEIFNERHQRYPTTSKDYEEIDKIVDELMASRLEQLLREDAIRMKQKESGITRSPDSSGTTKPIGKTELPVYKGPESVPELVSGMRDQIAYLNADGKQFLPVLEEWKRKLEPLSEEWKLIKDLEKDILAPKAGGTAGKNAVESLVENIRDRMQYLNEDGAKFLPILEEWQSKLKPLSAEWKLIEDLTGEIEGNVAQGLADSFASAEKEQAERVERLRALLSSLSWENQQGFLPDAEYSAALEKAFERMRDALSDPAVSQWTEEMKELFAALQGLKGSEAGIAVSALKMQFEAGSIGLEQYRAGLQRIKEEFAQYPAVVKTVEGEIAGLDRAVQGTARSLELMVREADTALNDKLTGFADDISGAFASAIVYGDSLSDTLKRLAQDIGYAALKAVLLRTIFGKGRIGGLFGFSEGAAFSGGHVTPFAKGGVVFRPTIFPMAKGMGLMGEAGPEAVMPLKRTADGSLGVTAEESGGTVINHFHINAVDAKSFAELVARNPQAIVAVVAGNYGNNGVIRRITKGA